MNKQSLKSRELEYANAFEIMQLEQEIREMCLNLKNKRLYLNHLKERYYYSIKKTQGK